MLSGRRNQRGGVAATITSIVCVILILGAAWAILNRQYVADVVTVMTFQPSSEIAAVEERIQLTEEGKFAFYSSEPELASGETFNEDCPRQEPDSPILGCYSLGKIYVYDVENEKLDGIEEVTAAHEMLHAVWERLSERERQDLEVVLTEVFEAHASAELQERMDYYSRSEPTEITNELHSILPTEVETIGDELEAYYATYFMDRQVILDYHDQYSSAFTELTSRADAVYKELEELAAQIDSETSQYDAAVAQLSRDINEFNSRASAGEFGSMQAFYTERAVLVSRSQSLQADHDALNGMIREHNELHQEYQTIVSEIEALNKSIDSISGPQEAPAL